MDHAARGDAALSASKYDEAIQCFDSAISANPTAVTYYIKRSTAYQRSAKYPEALADAEIAVVLAHKRARRELIKDAQLRRGIALYFTERYADADYILNIVKKLDDKEKTLAIWLMKAAAKLKDIPEGDEKRNVTAKEIPDVEVPSALSASARDAGSAKGETGVTTPKPVTQTPADKIKNDWYQNNENVTFNLLAKGVPKDKASVEIDKDSLSISFPIEASSSDYNYNLDPFFAPVDPAKSSFRITPNKIEVTLKKATPGVKWKTLEGDRAVENETEAEKGEKSTIPVHVLTGKTEESVPAYPTSSKSGVKNWDKLAEEDLGEEDEAEGDETSRFFKQLYKGASAEQQRAMMKSYQESGGTVLSTDWSNVGSKFVAPEPPEGMEAKKYSS